MFSDAAINGLAHVAAGVTMGTTLQVILPPIGQETRERLVMWTAAQTALNGIAIAAATYVLRSEADPTHGLLFIWALMATQPSLTQRLQALAGAMQDAAATELASLAAARPAKAS